MEAWLVGWLVCFGLVCSVGWWVEIGPSVGWFVGCNWFGLFLFFNVFSVASAASELFGGLEVRWGTPGPWIYSCSWWIKDKVLVVVAQQALQTSVAQQALKTLDASTEVDVSSNFLCFRDRTS